MNIALVTNSIGYGGVEKNVSFIANGLSKHGHNVFVINLGSKLQYVNSKIQFFDSKVSVIKIPCDRNGIRRRLCQIIRLVKISKAEKIHVLIGFTAWPNFLSKIASIIIRKPSIMAERGDPNITFRNFFDKNVMRPIINRSCGAVFQIEGASYFYSKTLRNRGVVIPNPIFVNKVPKRIKFENRNKTIVSVGRLDNKQKRYDVMLDAFFLFSKKHPDYILKIYGSGNSEEFINNRVHSLGLDDKIKMMGVSKDPITDIYKDGIFIITSDYEGISNALLEAMACGMPVLSTDSTPGGARMLITNNENGVIVPRGDFLSLAKALCRYVEEPSFADHCGENAMSVLEKYNPDFILSLWENYILSFKKS